MPRSHGNLMVHATALLLCAALAFATDATDECASSLAIEDVERYQRDGYVIVRNLFSAAEADVLRTAIETDPLVASNDMPMVDSAGSRSKLTLWNYAGNDTFGYFARGKRWANAARRLIGSPIYHFHTKVMLKEDSDPFLPRTFLPQPISSADMSSAAHFIRSPFLPQTISSAAHFFRGTSSAFLRHFFC